MKLLVTLPVLFIISMISVLLIFIIRKVAKFIGLLDKPDGRKQHVGKVPLVGGLSVFAGVVLALVISPYHHPYFYAYLSCASILVLVGALDDRFDISVKLRVLIQALIAIFMMWVANLHLMTLGFVLGPVELQLGPFGYLLTLLAVWAGINAFNMIDGIDGLLGSLSSVSFASLGFLFAMRGKLALAYWCFALIAAIIPYMLFNLGLFGQRFKIFMGDAGSTFIGFTIIWMLLEATQRPAIHIHPVTALWLIAIPLMDMVSIMYRRLRHGKSPFSADRQHIHHRIMHLGLSSRQALLYITLAAVLFAIIGVVNELFGILPEKGMLILFLLAFAGYVYCLKHAVYISRFLGGTCSKNQ